MVKIYAAARGAAIRIGNWGVATDEAPIEVPEEVAAEFSLDANVRLENNVPPVSVEADNEGEEEEIS